jgi:hypothetical protein
MMNTLQTTQLDGRKESFRDERFDDDKCLIRSHKYYAEVRDEENKLMNNLKWLNIESKK